ncbi:MAG TPA: zinc-binding dehydrogenase, partial [Anaerolineales bacterium]|nr:zinc-binding dehydrogenase [Anaerolineales bacterium]
PGPGEALIRIRAAALNRLDLWVREGWPGIRLTLPHVPGADGAGEIAELGPGTGDWKTGQKVAINASIGCFECDRCRAGFDNQCRRWEMLGETRRGTHAECVAVPVRNLHPLPDDFDLAHAAAAGLVLQTAWHSLAGRGGLQAGETVLVVGASGGTNTACIQVAKYLGAEVFVVGSSREKLALAESLGADHLVDRSQDPDWSRAVFLLTGKRGVDVVVDNVGTTFPQSFRTARKGGRILTVGNTGGPVFEIDNRYIFGKHLAVIGSTMSPQADFARVMDLVVAGALRAVIDRTFELAEIREAHRRLEQGEQLGKIVLAVP